MSSCSMAETAARPVWSQPPPGLFGIIIPGSQLVAPVTLHAESVAAVSANATPAANAPLRRPCPIARAIRGVLSSWIWVDRHGPCGLRHH